MTGTDRRKFVPLMRVVKSALVDSYEDIGKAQQMYMHWASRSLADLRIQGSISFGTRYAFLPVNQNTHTATLPVDFEEERFVGVVGANGMKIPLSSNDNLVNKYNIPTDSISEKCKVCGSPKSVCEDLQITEDTVLIDINGTSYEQKIIKRLYPNGDYYKETTTPYFDINTSTVVYNTTKEFIDHLDLKSCGCLDETGSNMAVLQRCAYDAYCRYYTPCDCSCKVDMGSFRIFEENGLIQLESNFSFPEIYIEYKGSMPKINGQLSVPAVAFETLVEATKYRSVKNRKNVSRLEKQDYKVDYLTARRNMDKVLGQVSLNSIIEAATRVPKFNVSYQSDWCGFFDWNSLSANAVTVSGGTGAGTDDNNTPDPNSNGNTTTVITNNNYINEVLPSLIVNGISFSSDGSYQLPSKYVNQDFLIYLNGIRYLTRDEYLIDPINAIVTVTIGSKPFSVDDNYILIPNGKLQ